MGTSKNSKKGSKPALVIRPEKVKKKKEFLYFEVTNKNYTSVKEQKDLSYFVANGKEFVIDKLEWHYGKLYFKVINN